MLITILRSAVTLLMLLLPFYTQADGASIAADKCDGCHALERPDFADMGISERLQRKAPPLYFAGNKYREQWLKAWLQNPQNLHPAGYFPNIAVQSTPEGDVPAPDGLHEHLVLDAATAAEVTEYLMSLRSHDELIAADNYQAGTVSARMGMLDFRKFKGCNACHQDAMDEGGFSGPVLFNAWERLQPAFISSYIQNPVAWDPNSIMPVAQMNEQAVHKLVHYLKLTGGEQ
ncbi:MAG: hypothetical protein WD601_04415 [Pseudohongiellaceae bacterium]